VDDNVARLPGGHHHLLAGAVAVGSDARGEGEGDEAAGGDEAAALLVPDVVRELAAQVGGDVVLVDVLEGWGEGEGGGGGEDLVGGGRAWRAFALSSPICARDDDDDDAIALSLTLSLSP
jgi:hypothetical protein